MGEIIIWIANRTPVQGSIAICSDLYTVKLNGVQNLPSCMINKTCNEKEPSRYFYVQFFQFKSW